jgi:hypothetical protein
VHTGWSYDATIYDVHLGPDNAFRHGRGEEVPHPAGYTVQLKLPLDFMVVSDHAEYLGVIQNFFNPDNPLSNLPIARQIIESGDDVEKSTEAFYGLVAAFVQEDGSVTADPLLNTELQRSSNWSRMVQVVDEYNDPGTFTTLAAFEWSSTPFSSNLHRVVIFRDTDHLPEMVYSYFDSYDPRDLWDWMDAQRDNGSTLLAIPHNGNLSNGLMYPDVDLDGNPIDEAYAESRMRNEKLTEIIQTKGQSETHPVMAPNDEFAGFEIWTKPIASGGQVDPNSPNSYVREAFKRGLKFEQSTSIGINPFKYGVVGGADVHTSIISHEEYAFTGEHNLKSATPEQRLQQSVPNEPSKIEQGTAGLSCVWAESNTREAIYDAMERKETWGTSGPRITVRVFAAYDYDETSLTTEAWLEDGYINGVEMGGDLGAAPANESPKLMMWATKGPNSGNLDRIQVIKGWVDAQGVPQEKIFNVVWSGGRVLDANGDLPPVGNTVDIPAASYTNTIGSPELSTLWTDPDFDPNLPAFYYLRVLEIPTPRWSTYDAKVLGIDPPAEFPASIEERAWTSPIWYRPNS